MARVPNTGPDQRERQRLIAKLEADLRALDRIPAHQREAELADTRTETALALLGDLKGGLPLVRKGPNTSSDDDALLSRPPHP